MNQDIKHVWTVLCEKSSIDSQSNNLSLFNVTEQLNFTRDISVNIGKTAPNAKASPEVVPFGVELVSLWRRPAAAKLENVKFEARIEFIDPKGVVLQTMDIVPEFQHFRRTRTRINWQGLAVTVAGEYFFRVSIRKGNGYEIVAEVPLEIVLKATGIGETQPKFASVG